MSQFSLYIKAPDYLRDWLRHDFWNAETGRVEFPRNSQERIVLELFLKKAPADVQPPTAEEGMLRVEVPSTHGKNPATFNYLSPAGETAFLSTIKRRFKKLVWDELHVIRPDEVQITDIVYAFLDKHGIEPTETNWETVRQMYARLRKIYVRPSQVK